MEAHPVSAELFRPLNTPVRPLNSPGASKLIGPLRAIQQFVAAWSGLALGMVAHRLTRSAAILCAVFRRPIDREQAKPEPVSRRRHPVPTVAR